MPLTPLAPTDWQTRACDDADCERPACPGSHPFTADTL